MKEYQYQNSMCFEVMNELINSQTNMLNPVLTKFIQLNTIFYSKTTAHMAPIGAIDPNAGLAQKILSTSGKNKYEAISKAKDLPNQFDKSEYGSVFPVEE